MAFLEALILFVFMIFVLKGEEGAQWIGYSPRPPEGALPRHRLDGLHTSNESKKSKTVAEPKRMIHDGL